MNFSQSSYNVREDDGAVMIELIMSRPSSQPFEAVISLTDITTTGNVITYVLHVTLEIVRGYIMPTCENYHEPRLCTL